jgi:hypothetical protein
MKYLTLLTAAYVGGVLRHPHEGAIPVADDEAKRLLDNKAAEDVTDGFSAAQLKAATPEPVTAPGGPVPAEAPANPHQSEVPASPAKPAGRKPAAEKE